MTTKNTAKPAAPELPPIRLQDIEEGLSQHGHFALLDWLLAENLLPYAAYEQWRSGQSGYLDAQLNLGKTALLELAETIADLAGKLRLEACPEDYYAWSENRQQTLLASQHPALNRALTLQWKRRQGAPQLDLFLDNTATIAENALLQALANRDFKGAQTQVEKLTTLNASHKKLGGYQDLINYGYHMQQPSIAVENLDAELHALEEEVVPLAKNLLQHRARDYLAFAWRRLEHNLGQVAFSPEHPRRHRSYALLQIPDWEAAARCLESEAAQYQQPALLLRSALCYEALKHSAKALLCWCLRVEHDPASAAAAIEKNRSSLIWPLWQRYCEGLDEVVADRETAEAGGTADHHNTSLFCAYVFMCQPGLVHQLHSVPPLQSPATHAVIAAIQDRQKGRDPIPSRTHMQQISPLLLHLYMATLATV